MSSVCDEETPSEAPSETPERKRSLGGSMSLRTRKLGRRLSRSMSIVALKLPDAAHSLQRTSSKLIRNAARDKKNRSFELSIILPDKTQRQVTVSGSTSVASLISEILQELNMQLAGSPSAPLSAPTRVAMGAPLPAPSSPIRVPPAAMLYLGGSRAPVNPRAGALALEGEVLLVEEQPPHWDGRNLDTFIAWENIYASTLSSAIELYGKPLLRAAVISKEEYHLLFYYLETVSEASTALTIRMKRYIDSGLLKREGNHDSIEKSDHASEYASNEQPKSILNELVQEGFLTQRDINISSDVASEYTDNTNNKFDEVDSKSIISSAPSIPKMTVNLIVDSVQNHSCDIHSNSDNDDKLSSFSVSTKGQCCTDHKISADMTDNVWSNVQWDFLNPTDFGYDQIRSVKRSRSDSAISPLPPRRRDEIYETLKDVDDESCDGVTPYESIEDLYDCIKNAQYRGMTGDSSPSTETHSEPRFSELFYEKSSNDSMRKSSTTSEKSGTSSSEFPLSKCGSNSVGCPNGLRQAESPLQTPQDEESESDILLRQLFTGELSDAYAEFLAAYPHARALLRRKNRTDEHFVALADIRRGVAKYAITDYLQLPIERLAQYERLVGAGNCGRRRATRLSDLERVQDLFPHDYLALHEHDAQTSLSNHHAQKTKSLRKRPSLDLSGTVSAGTSLAPRTFLMEAPVQLCPLGSTSPALDRHLFLFSDLLLVGKSRGTNCFKLKESVRLSEAWISLTEVEDTGFILGWPTTAGVANYLAVYPTQAARDTWFRKIQNALNTQLATEPKSTNIQVLYKDTVTQVECCKTLSVVAEMSAESVCRAALALLQNNNVESESGWGSTGALADFLVCVRAGREAPPVPLHGVERPHAIQMSKIRQTLSSEDGFDLEHVNAKKNPCGLVFELRRKSQGLKSGVVGSGSAARGLRLLRRGGGSNGRLWGVSLARLCAGGGAGTVCAPPPLLLLVLRRLRALAPNTHGVFRRSANAKALRLLRDKLDAMGPWAEQCQEVERAPVLLLAALLKDFFRALPQPLLCRDLYSNWITLLGLPTAEKMTAVRSLLLKLPKAHYTMLTYFICLLASIAKKSNINLMCPMNLGVCVGPSLLWPSTPCDKAPKAVPMIIELLIVKAEALFGPQIMGLLGSGSPESSNALLDSGAEESDSLHSVGISLDSMELSSPRKEKLSLSRDSGLTLSEDDSNSNGGNSPAPRNILHSLSVPTCVNLQQESKINNSRFTNDGHNINGLPQINQRQSIYANKADVYSSAASENHYASPYSGERYVHNSINIGISNGTISEERNYITKSRSDAIVNRRDNDIYGQSPAKYITGFEPQKPPRSNVSKAARTSKVFSMFAETQASENGTQITKPFNRAKSSDNLLDIKQEQTENQRDFISSQENILYSNINDLTTFTENMQRQRAEQYQSPDILANTNYSRVYTGWEKRSSNYTKPPAIRTDSIYDYLPSKQDKNASPNKHEGTPTATIFTRNDWSRQAARTKSLDVNEETYITNSDANKLRAQNDLNNINSCRKRRFDPAHMCTKSCSQGINISTREQLESKNNLNPLQTSYSYIEKPHNSPIENKKTKYRNHNNNRLNTSKSLANIILQSDSSSSDTLYQPHGSSYNSRSTDSPASETSFENTYSTQYIEPMYTSIYNRQRDIYLESKNKNSEVFSSDIYTATPTAVKPEYNTKQDLEEKPQNPPPHLPPPVPPRKMVYQKVIKKFTPVHVNKDDKSRSKSVPPAYREPPLNHETSQNTEVKHVQKVISLDCSDTDTESESYV